MKEQLSRQSTQSSHASLTAAASDWREGRRLRAFELYQQEGWTQQRIATALGVTQGAVSQWMSRAQAGGGPQALFTRPPKGATPRLTAVQLEELPDLLKQGAQSFGFVGEVWTRERVGAVIERAFGVRYHKRHVGRILDKIGWSVQKPVPVAAQRDEDEVTEWKEEGWPSLKKGG
jgi:transposase